MRARLGLALPLVAALIVAGCGGLGASNGSLCPAPTLEPVTTPGG
ncbi:MAG: lipoprotein-34 precursor (NlpB), partial [Chloroflexi bacterium]